MLLTKGVVYKLMNINHAIYKMTLILLVMQYVITCSHDFHFSDHSDSLAKRFGLNMRTVALAGLLSQGFKGNALQCLLPQSQVAKFSTIGAMRKVAYATDIEGNLEYWNKYLSISNVLRREDNNKLVLEPDCQFVYGGDVCDRGWCNTILHKISSVGEC